MRTFPPNYQPNNPYIYRVIVGNIIGVVEEPTTIVPAQPMIEQAMVKIGVVDPHGGFSTNDCEEVIQLLHAFVANLR